jgi:hypothetical protein
MYHPSCKNVPSPYNPESKMMWRMKLVEEKFWWKENLSCNNKTIPGDISVFNPTAKILFTPSRSFSTLRHWIPTKQHNTTNKMMKKNSFINKEIVVIEKGKVVVHTFQRNQRSWFQHGKLGREGEMTETWCSVPQMSLFPNIALKQWD